MKNEKELFINFETKEFFIRNWKFGITEDISRVEWLTEKWKSENPEPYTDWVAQIGDIVKIERMSEKHQIIREKFIENGWSPISFVGGFGVVLSGNNEWKSIKSTDVKI